MTRTNTTGLVLLLACGTAVAAPATQPATQATTRPAGATQHDMVRVETTFNRRTLVDAYDAVGQHSPLWNVPVRAFLDRMAVRFAEDRFDQIYKSGVDTSNDTLVALADGLDGCQDPVVNVCRAIVYKNVNKDDLYRSLVIRWAPDVLASKYPANRKFEAANALAPLKWTPKLHVQWEELQAAMLLMPLADPQERRVVAYATDQRWQKDDRPEADKVKTRQKVVDLMAADPKVDPWLLAMVRSRHAYATAWAARGNGFAATVTPEGWKLFRANMVKARAAMLVANKLEPQYAESCAEMIAINMDGSAEEQRTWFERARAIQIDSRPAWITYCNTLRPRWGGTLDAMQALAKEAADTKRYDTRTPYMAVQMLHMMTEEDEAGDGIFRWAGVWDILAGVFDGYLDAATNHTAPNVDVPWMRTVRAAYAWKCGQYDEAKKTFDTLGDQARPEAVAFLKIPLDTIQSECRALTGPRRDVLHAAADDETAFAFEKARAAYDATLRGMETSDPDRPYVLRHLAATAISAALTAGKAATVPLNGPDDLLAFTGDLKGWQVKDGELTYDGPANNISKITHLAELPPRTRIKLDYFWTTPNPAAHAPGLDVIVQDTIKGGLLAFHGYPRDNLVELNLGPDASFMSFRARPAPVASNAWHTLEIDHDGTTLTLRQDGNVLINRFNDDWLSTGKSVLGLGVYGSPVGQQVRFRNMTIEMIP